MPYLFLGLITLVILLIAGRLFISASPGALAVAARRLAGAVALVVALVLLFTGRWAFAVPIGLVGLGLLTGNTALFGSFASRVGMGGLGRRTKAPGRTSSVRTVFLDMALDHDSGTMNGRVLAGEYDGRLLSDMPYADLMTLRRECVTDPQSLALLETYLDRTHPDWRAEWHDEETAAHREENGRSTGPMTRGEARAILGVSAGCDADEVRKAHKQLMKRFHPDHGGSDYLAAKINEAKDILLRGP